MLAYNETFGVKPKVVYKIDASIPTLNQIFDAVQEEFQKVCPNRTLEERKKDFLILKYRRVYYSVCLHYKYSLHSMCCLTSQVHSTVIATFKSVPENSELKNKIIQKLKTINY